MTRLSPRLSRRAMIGGLVGGLAAVRAAPAWAQLDFLRGGGGGFDLDAIISGAGNIFEALSLSEDDEIEMGEKLYGRLIDRSGGIYRNSVVQQAVRDFAAPLFATSQRRAFRWEITVLADDTVNAWALPGGKLAVNAGLLRYTEDDEDLAAVLAHEMGHAELSHALEEMRSDKFSKGLTSVGREALSQRLKSKGSAGLLAEEALDQLEGPMLELIGSGYSRSNEMAADAHILTVFPQLGLHPAKASNVFHTLLQIIPADTGGTTSLFNSHPGTRARIEKIEAAAARMPRPSQPARLPGLKQIKATFPTRHFYRRSLG